jgi:uncharacterized protein
MDSEYITILRKAESKHAANKKFLSFLSKRKIPKFDNVVHAIHKEVFEQIDCKKCANCCRVLGPRLNMTDIDRFAAVFRISESTFRQKYLRTDEDDDLVFKSMPCPFIEVNDLCSVYESRPRACRQYPHTDEKNVQTKLPRLVVNSLYCPAAVLIIEKIIGKYS